MAECRAEAGTGVVFTYYKDYNCFETMRQKFPTAGASVPGGQACLGSQGLGVRGAAVGAGVWSLSGKSLSGRSVLLLLWTRRFMSRPASLSYVLLAVFSAYLFVTSQSI